MFTFYGMSEYNLSQIGAFLSRGVASRLDVSKYGNYEDRLILAQVAVGHDVMKDWFRMLEKSGIEGISDESELFDGLVGCGLRIVDREYRDQLKTI